MEVILDKAQNQFAQNLPFVLYCKPNSDTIIGVFQHDDALHSISDFTESGFAFVAFDGEKKYFIPSESSDVYVEKVSSDAFYLSNTTAIVTNDFHKKSGLTYFLKGKTGEKNVSILDSQESYLLNSFAVADCLVELDEEIEDIKKGTLVNILMII